MKYGLFLTTAIALCLSSQLVSGQDYDPYSWDPGKGSSSGGGGGSLFGASDLNYGYIEASYFSFDFSDEAIDAANGFGIELSVPVVDSLYLTASLLTASPEDADGNELESDYVSWELGAGIGLPLGNGFDLVLEGGLARREFTGDFLADPVDGYGIYLAPGVRWQLNDVLELNAGLKYYSVDELNDLGFEAKALIHLTPSISLQGSAFFGDTENHYGVGARLSF